MAPAPSDPRIGAVVLAAGGSSRMGGRNKLLESIEGRPVLLHVINAALAVSLPEDVVVVTGHQEVEIHGAVHGVPVRIASNPRWQEGMSTSLATGLAALEERVDGALICLGDMPRVSPDDTRALAAAFHEDLRSGRDAAPAYVPVHEGLRGNPVLWSAAWFAELGTLTGDRGARALLEQLSDRIVHVAASAGVLVDADTPAALEQLRGGKE